MYLIFTISLLPHLQGIIFEKLTESELQQRINILMGRKPRPGRPVKNAERKRIAQELARRAAEVKHRKKIEHQGWGQYRLGQIETLDLLSVKTLCILTV